MGRTLDASLQLVHIQCAFHRALVYTQTERPVWIRSTSLTTQASCTQTPCVQNPDKVQPAKDPVVKSETLHSPCESSPFCNEFIDKTFSSMVGTLRLQRA